MAGSTVVDAVQQICVVAADRAVGSNAEALVVQVTTEADLAHLSDLDAESVAWVEVPLELAHRDELNDFSVDVVLSDPEKDAGRLYELARVREPLRPRITLTTTPGFAAAAAVAMSLHFPLRLLPRRPSLAEVNELEKILQRYLQDPAATEVVEPFHSALSALLHQDETTLWDAVDENPAWIKMESKVPPVEEHIAALIEQGRECASCRLQGWCAGWFKWPDPDYDCVHVRELFLGLETTARQLRSDLDEALEVIP